MTSLDGIVASLRIIHPFDMDIIKLLLLQAIGCKYNITFETIYGETYCNFNIALIGQSQVGKSMLMKTISSMFTGIYRELLNSTGEGIWNLCVDVPHGILIKDEFGGVLRSYGKPGSRYGPDWYRNLQVMTDSSGVGSIIEGRVLSECSKGDITDPNISVVVICTPEDMESSPGRDLFMNGWWNRFLMMEEFTQAQFRDILRNRHALQEDMVSCNNDVLLLGKEDINLIDVPDEVADWLDRINEDLHATDGWWQRAQLNILKISAILAFSRGDNKVNRNDFDEAWKLVSNCRDTFDRYHNTSTSKEYNMIMKYIIRKKKVSRSLLTKHVSGVMTAKQMQPWIDTLVEAGLVKQSGTKNPIFYSWIGEEEE